PSGNAVAAMTGMAMGEPEVARRTLSVFARQLRDQAEGMSSMVQAALVYVRQFGSFTVEAAPNAPRAVTPEQVAAGVVSMRASWASPMQLNVQVNVLEGFHINANEPGKGLVETTLAVSGVQVESIEYPPGE